LILEKFRKFCRSTAFGIATIFVGFENSTRIITAARSPQLIGALPIDITGTSYTTGAPISCGAKFHGNIKPVNKRDIKEVQVAKLV
jgi:hypothetical protein